MLEGKVVKEIRPMTDEEWARNGGNECTVIEFTDGSVLFALTNKDADGPGVLVYERDGEVDREQFFL